MKKLPLLLIVLTGVLLAGCGTPSAHRKLSGLPTREVTITVRCSGPRMRFTGTIVTDGHAKQVTGTGTRCFHATGHEFVCSFQKTGVEGQISLSVSSAGENLGNAYTGQRFGGVRAEVLGTAAEPRQVFSTF